MVNMGFWTVLPFEAVQHLPHLALAPAGVVPQRERRPRPIMDYTFNSVNQDSTPLAPYGAMQFGPALSRLLQHVVYANPDFGPVYLAKLDLADGYYRIPLAPHAAQQLAVVLPPDHDTNNLIGIPLSLPMGWAQSPPYFCAFTETCADMANAFLAYNTVLPTHALEAETQPTPHSPCQPPRSRLPWQASPPNAPTAHVDVYIDDFILAAQRPRLDDTMRATVHSIETVFHDDPAAPRRQVISRSKLNKGDGSWSTTKRVLGWDIDTALQTIHLPPHRQARLEELISPLLTQSRVSRAKWFALLGELRSMVPALHGSKYLFSILQHTLCQNTPRLRLSGTVKSALADWLCLARMVAAHPAPLQALVPTAPATLGAADACGTGMGGFWVATDIHPQPFPPIIWRARFCPKVKAALVSSDNPKGSLTNSDLELAGYIAGHTLLPPTLTHTSVLCATDNTPTHAWARKGSPTSDKANAFLLRLLAQQCRSKRQTLLPCFTPGTTNTLADFCSRSWHLSDAQFLHMANCRFPLPQQSWTLAHLTTDTQLQLNSALFRKHRPLGSQPLEPTVRQQHGTYGRSFAWPWPKVPPWATLKTQSLSSACSRIATEVAPWLPPVLKSSLEQWRAPFVPWGRRWPHWASPTPVCSSRESSTYVSNANLKHMTNKMTPQHASNPSLSMSSPWPSTRSDCLTPQKRTLLRTCSSWASSSCFAQENMQTVTIPTPPRSASMTSTSSASSNESTSCRPQNQPFALPLLPPLSSPTKKMESAANSSVWDAPVTQPYAQSSPLSTASFTSGCIEQNRTPNFSATTPAPIGLLSIPPRSLQPYARPPQPSAPPPASNPPTFPHAPYAPPAQWRYSAPESTQTSYVY